MRALPTMARVLLHVGRDHGAWTRLARGQRDQPHGLPQIAYPGRRAPVVGLPPYRSDHRPLTAPDLPIGYCSTRSSSVGNHVNVLMLLGGPPRCGKTMLAQRIALERRIGWLSLDTVRDVVDMLLPALYESGGPGVPPDAEASLSSLTSNGSSRAARTSPTNTSSKVSDSCRDTSRRYVRTPTCAPSS